MDKDDLWHGRGVREVAGALKTNLKLGNSASDTYAHLVREQWQDYKTRFTPWEDHLINLANGQEDNLLSEQRASNAVNNSFGLAQASLGRDRSRLGITLTDEEKANETRLGAGLQSAATNAAVLKARLHAKDRDNSLLSGGAGPNINTALEK